MNPEGHDPVELRSKTVNQPLKKGDVFSMWTQGGGGYGPPGQRDADALARDLREGKVSEAVVESDYRGTGASK